MRIEVGTIKTKICTDNPQLLRELVKLYTFNVPGYEFSTAYRQRRWDGKQRFISKTGVFKTGLLNKILKDLAKIECSPEIVLNPELPSSPEIQKIQAFDYYPFQETFINKALTDRRGIVKSPTGSGKTLIMAGIVKALHGRKMVILFNAKQLLTQTYDFLTKKCGIENVGLCFGEGYIYGDIMLCTVQSIDKILDTHLEDTEVLLVDEAHEFANGKVTLAAINSFPKAQYRIGFTATPPSSEGIPQLNLIGAFGDIWKETSTHDLIEEGKLTKPLIQLIRLPSASGSDENLSYTEIYETFIIENEERNKKIYDIISFIKQKNKRARILILVKNLKHAEKLHKALEGSFRLWGDDEITSRYETISKFLKAKESTILIGTKVLQTGVNIEELTHFINARGLKSEIATLQALGRALRRHESKDRVYIYDFMDNVKYLKKHSQLRKNHYLSEGHEVEIL